MQICREEFNLILSRKAADFLVSTLQAYLSLEPELDDEVSCFLENLVESLS